ncbi:MAG: NAD(P)-dependent oxidoreductase [Alphaproteobacteria bacterium]|nr:NAD(P)-dependent oxidoreductase [Alphaproteobacteria bacterium]
MTQGIIERLGFIGLGVMGEPMCRNLLAAGKWQITAFDLDPAPLARLRDQGAKAAGSPEDLAGEADMIITCLPGGNEVRDVFFGSGRLIERVGSGQILVDMSTSPPALMRELAAAASERGADFADAPIARTRQAATDGSLAIMVGADQVVFDAIRPVLSVMGSDIMHCGAAGAGQVIKIMNNMVLFQTVQALAEAVTIAEGAGVDGQTLLATMAKGSGDSFALRNHAMKSLLPEVFPVQAFSVRYAAKDLAYALDMAAEQGVVASGAINVAQRFEEAIAGGYGDLYFPVIRRLLKET